MAQPRPSTPGMPILDDRSQYSMLLHDLADTLARRLHDPTEATTRRILAGVPILPPPPFCATLVASGNNVTIDFEIPDTVSIISFSALLTVDYAVSFGTRCAMPRVQSNLSGTLTPNDSIAVPNGQFFYVRNIRRLSIGIAAAAAVVSVFGWQQA